MALAHHVGLQNTAGGLQGVHSGVDALLHDLTAQHGGGVQMGEGSGGRGVGQVIGGHVNGLHAGDGAVLGGGDSLLQRADLVGQGGLVAHGAGHTAHQGGNLAAGLHVTEDVVDEQQHVPLFLIAEVLGHGQTGQSNAHTGSRGLVHLAEDQGGLLQNAGLAHLAPQVVALTGTLAHAGEDGVAAVFGGDVTDQLLDQHGLANARAAEQADLTAAGVGGQQVDDLATPRPRPSLGLSMMQRTVLPPTCWATSMTCSAPFSCTVRASLMLAGAEHDAAHGVAAHMLGDLHDLLGAVQLHGQGIVDGGQLAVLELNVHNGAQNLCDGAFVLHIGSSLSNIEQ